MTVDVRDSLTLHATFDKPVDPAQSVRQRAHHGARGGLLSYRIKAIVSAREIDKQRTDSPQSRDSIRARHGHGVPRTYLAQHWVPTDSNAIAAVRRAALLAEMTPSKPIPVSDVLITLTKPLATGATYQVESKDIRNLMGISGTRSVRSVCRSPRLLRRRRNPARHRLTVCDGCGERLLAAKPTTIPAQATPPADTSKSKPPA